MKTKVCDLCNSIITQYSGALKVKVKKKIFYGSYENGIVVPNSLYIGIDICSNCVKEIIKKSKERGLK